MKVWEEPLDQEGSATYSIDFTKEMTRLGESLSFVDLVLSQEAIDAGLEQNLPLVSNNIFSVKFSINTGKRTFSKKGTPLSMRVKYTSSGGETDAETFILVVKDK